MVQLTLPKNSKVTAKGNVYAATGAGDAGKRRRFKVYRYNPDVGENPRLDSYEIDMTGVSM
ncbi:MAG: succinate dehydrogenase iron-sulfur subunit, partial [Parvularculaceae bacterium]